MPNELSPLEKDIAISIAKGMNANQICDWHQITYREYICLKRRILRKLNIKRMTQIFQVLLNMKLL